MSISSVPVPIAELRELGEGHGRRASLARQARQAWVEVDISLPGGRRHRYGDLGARWTCSRRPTRRCRRRAELASALCRPRPRWMGRRVRAASFSAILSFICLAEPGPERAGTLKAALRRSKPPTAPHAFSRSAFRTVCFAAHRLKDHDATTAAAVQQALRFHSARPTLPGVALHLVVTGDTPERAFASRGGPRRSIGGTRQGGHCRSRTSSANQRGRSFTRHCAPR